MNPPRTSTLLLNHCAQRLHKRACKVCARFASDRYGNFDVFVMDANGGAATRLTFHSNDESPFTFSSDNNSVIFGAQRMDTKEHRQYPTGSQPELYSVPVKGGRVDQIFTIPAEYVQVSKDGNTMVYHDKKGGESEWRKHHVSSITRDLWIYDKPSNTHKMLTTRAGEDRQPVFSADEKSVYYLSEESGTFNVRCYTLCIHILQPVSLCFAVFRRFAVFCCVSPC